MSSRKEGASAPSASVEAGAGELRDVLQAFVRKFGLLLTNQTPCGYPLSPSHAHALMALLERKQRGETSSQSDLGEILHVDKSNVARLSARMEEAGHIVQETPEHDGRARHLVLTAKGSRLARKLEEASRDRLSRIASRLTVAERRQLFASFERLNAAIDFLEEEDHA